MNQKLRSLIILAHGSRLGSANEEFFAVVDQVSRIDCDYQHIYPAFLEMAQPSLLEAANQAVQDGAKGIDVYPLFFNQGRHVGKDIPAQIAEAMEAHPDIDIAMLAYFGSDEKLASSIVRHINEQRPMSTN